MARLYGRCFFFLLSISFATGCSPLEGDYVEPTLVEKLQWTDVVLYGRILQHFPSDFYETEYTALMTVYCVLRGPVSPPLVNITQAGYVPGFCFSNDLEIDEEYIALLRYDAETDIYSISEVETPAALKEVSQTCGITPLYPQGVSEASFPGKQCPAQVSSDECVGITSNSGRTYSLHLLLMFLLVFLSF